MGIDGRNDRPCRKDPTPGDAVEIKLVSGGKESCYIRIDYWDRAIEDYGSIRACNGLSLYCGSIVLDEVRTCGNPCSCQLSIDAFIADTTWIRRACRCFKVDGTVVIAETF